MSTPFVCGTGLYGSGVKPGDPDNNIYINAETTYGGIKVSWSYPTVNSHGVAYIRLYRGVNAVFSNAVQLGIVSGSVYFDQLKPEADTRYWYWVQLVSVNGTVMEPIGPASAVAKKHAAQVIDQIMQEINEGVLATSLREKIEKITLNYNELQAEIANRVSGNAALSAALAQVQSGVLESLGLINEEITIRTNGQDALASQVNTIASINATNAAAIIDERYTRVTADEALSTRIDSTLAATNANAAAVVVETNARASADAALAWQITDVQSSAGNNLAAVQTNLQTNINTVDGKVVAIGALWTAKVQANDLVGGFGVYNDGRTVEAGFDVDRFWIGRTGPDRVLPFVVDNGTVYIAKARIKDADIDTLKIAGNAVTVPIVAEGLYDIAHSPTPHWYGTMDSGQYSLPGNAYVHVTVAVECDITWGGDCNLACHLVSSTGGELQIFNSTQTMRANDKLTVIFVGGITTPHGDDWKFRIRTRNSWSNGVWTSKKVTLFAIGAKR